MGSFKALCSTKLYLKILDNIEDFYTKYCQDPMFHNDEGFLD